MTTPKQITYKLVRYAHSHPETQLAVFEIPQIPGYRRQSRTNKSVAESLTTTLYAVPIALANPYLAGGLFVDYFVHGRHNIVPKHPQIPAPDDLTAWARSGASSSLLTSGASAAQNPDSASIQAPVAAADGPAKKQPDAAANSGLEEMKATHE
jgi:hypothetical protein